jgi:hypothetical protein
MKDFFISYNRHDKQWSEWIAWTLEEAGKRSLWKYETFNRWQLCAVYGQSVQEAKQTIAFFLNTFSKQTMCAPNGQRRLLKTAGTTAHPHSSEGGRVCAQKGLLKQLVYVDLVGVAEAEAKQRLLDGLKERAKPDQAPSFPGTATPQAERVEPDPVTFPGITAHSQAAPVSLSLSTYDAQTWVGRDDLLQTLTQKLEGGYRVLVLTGMTGIGKTALAEHLVVNVQGRGVPLPPT